MNGIQLYQIYYWIMKSRMDAWQEFLALEKQHQIMKLPVKLGAMLNNCEYTIHKQFNKNSKQQFKYKKRKNQLPIEFRYSFKSLTLDQKLNYYGHHMKMVIGYFNGQLHQPQQLFGIHSGQAYARSYDLKIWKQKVIRLDRQKCILYAERQNKIKSYKLEDYMLRKSKNTDYHSFVLEAKNDNPHEKSRTVHLGFKDKQSLDKWYEELTAVFNYLQRKFIVTILSELPLVLKKMTINELQSRRSSGLEVLKKIPSENSQRQIEIENLSRSVSENSLKINNRGQKQKQELQGFKKRISLSEELAQYSQPQTKKKQSEVQPYVYLTENSSMQEENSELVVQQKLVYRERRKTVIESISMMDQEDIEEIQEHDSAPEVDSARQDIFHKILPEYNLKQLPNLINYELVSEYGPIKTYSDRSQSTHLKFMCHVSNEDLSPENLLIILNSPELLKTVNPEIQDYAIKTLIKSENSALIHMQLKQFSRLYRPRDFVFLRHVFRVAHKDHYNLYIVDKSIQNINYPPFTTIVRGQLVIVWRIRKRETGLQIMGDTRIKNQGYLKQAQEIKLATKFINGFKDLEKIQQQIIQNDNRFISDYAIFDNKWNIGTAPKQQGYKSQRSNTNSSTHEKQKMLQPPKAFKKKQYHEVKLTKQTKSSHSIEHISTQEHILQKFHSLRNSVPLEQQTQNISKQDKKSVTQTGQINIEQLEQQQAQLQSTVSIIKRDFNEKGHVIINSSFTKTKYKVVPLPKSQIKYMEKVHGHHPIWKGEWEHDEKLGGIIFVNEKKIEDQKGVLKFILTKIGKNILSGKSVMNISLPVDIFSPQSNLQALMSSLCFAPTKIEPFCKDRLLQRFKQAIGFGVSNSPLYLNMEKPFNPILGQTFQCFINGCPGYAEQISHHPPIAALFLKGRGYEITAQLQSKVQLHMNSGCGTNDGIFKIKYDDGKQICYITPGGQVSGLTYGDRKFNMRGTSYYWTRSNEKYEYFLQLFFNPTQKGFFSIGKQQKPIDYFQGTIYKVTSEFVTEFLKKRKGSPTDKHIIEKVGVISGIWNKMTMFDQECLLDIDTEFPAKMEYQMSPLPSDANWRQDIAYRRLLQITRAQTQKQRLEISQRRDRKLRAKHSQNSK